MPINKKVSTSISVLLATTFSSTAIPSLAGEQKSLLEEVIVTAQKREENLQKAPVAISVLGSKQLEAQRITGLDTIDGVIPSLKINPALDAPGALLVGIRGRGPSDISPVTREGPVAVYLDGIYLPRPQGVSIELPDLERIEVLRGPQGTLFGRNSTGGAVSLISKKPSGNFDIEQTLGAGNYNAFNSISRINLPEYAGVRAKLNYIHSEHDGYVKNPAPGESDFSESQNDGGQASINWQPTDNWTIDYRYEKFRVVTTSGLYQLYVDNIGLVGEERDRVSEASLPTIPLRPNYTNQAGHSLIAGWDISPALTLKSLTSYRTLDINGFTNFGSANYADGLMFVTDSDQSQFSQELQTIGTAKRMDWVGGLYYYRDDAKEISQQFFSLDTFGSLPENAGTINTPINPPTNVLPATGDPVPAQTVKANTVSKAAYGQVTWTPPILQDRLHLTLGARYTSDTKDGSRVDFGYLPYDLNSHHWDSLITIDYAWSDEISTYIKRNTGYRSGSVNPRSLSFAPYDPEEVTNWETGIKSEFLDRRLRINADVFRTYYEHMQADFPSPVDPTVSDTFNAEKRVRMDGAEVDLQVAPVSGLLIGVSYTYLHADMPIQPNPWAEGSFRKFYLTQTPQHAGSFTADYTFAPWRIGTLVAHFDVTSTSPYGYIEDTPYADGYTLYNAGLALQDVALGRYGNLRIAVWGKNLTNETYAATGFQFGEDPTQPFFVTQMLGDPRTFGIDLTWRFGQK